MTNAKGRNYWLMKSEPDVYSIDDLARDGRTFWEGVRNYQARNFMRDGMKVGDLVLFYHSSATPAGVAGVARVASEAKPDPTQFDKKSPYYDADSPRDAPRWFAVDLEFVEKLPRFVSLETLKGEPALDEMWVRKRGQRLSVQPVDAAHFAHVYALGGGKKKRI